MEGGIFQVEKTPHQWQVPRLDRTGHLRETKGQVGWLKLGEEGNEVRGPGELGQAGPHRLWGAVGHSSGEKASSRE